MSAVTADAAVDDPGDAGAAAAFGDADAAVNVSASGNGADIVATDVAVTADAATSADAISKVPVDAAASRPGVGLLR